MSALLIVVGLVWAGLGVANIIGMPWAAMGGLAPALGAFGLMFNMLLFILPGLVVAGIGFAISKRNRGPSSDGAAASSAGSVTRTCPYCAEAIKAEAIVCRYCGRDVPPTAPDTTPKVEWPDQDLGTKIGIFVAKVTLILFVTYVVYHLFGG